MHATHGIDVKNADAALEHPMVEVKAVKNFLKNIKYFVSTDTILFVKT